MQSDLQAHHRMKKPQHMIQCVATKWLVHGIRLNSADQMYITH